MSVIGTNYLALVSQNNLTRSQSTLGSAIERLSSGMRINSAKDDAAGQAIANRFTANIRGLTQAARNANDGISIAQTTEGSLNEINENLQRIREQVVQALNGSNSASDLDSIQKEINERLGEIDRISAETQFNGKYVLGKDGASLSIQVGANDSETITINLQEINSQVLGLQGFSVGTAGIETSKIGATVSTVAVDTAVNLGGLSAPTAATGATAEGLYMDDDGDYFVNFTGGTGTEGYYAATVAADGTVSVASSATAASPGTYTAVTTVPVDTNLTAVPAGMTVKAYDGGDAGPAYILVDDSGDEPLYYAAEVGADGAVTQGEELTVGSPATADPLKALDKALQQVDDLRSHLGAIQNRFESTVANLNNTVNNLSAARSRIEDADYAVEVSNMTRAQILQQAGTSVLAQANQIPQTVLSLLR